MKKIILIMSLLTTSVVSADNPCQTSNSPYAPMNCTKGTVNTVQADGPVNMTDTIVKQSTSVNGVFNAQNATLGDLTVNGIVNLTGVKIKGVTNIQGMLTANTTKFLGALTVASNAVTLVDSNAINIQVDNSPNGVVSPQVLTLAGNTVVSGDITFATPGGVVNIDSTAKIVGKVHGGVIHLKPVQAATTDVVANDKNVIITKSAVAQ